MRIKELIGDIRAKHHLERIMLENNSAVVILINDHNPLDEDSKETILNNISWLEATDEDSEWAIFGGDMDINILRVKDYYSSEQVTEVTCLANSIYLVDPECMPETCKRIVTLLLKYQELVIKEMLDAAIEEDSKPTEDQQYEDELFTTISKRRHRVLDKCFKIFELNQTDNKLKQIN